METGIISPLIRKGRKSNLGIVPEAFQRVASDGGAEAKRVVPGRAAYKEKAGNHRMQMVVKGVGVMVEDETIGDAKTPSEAFYNKWILLKSLGVPTIPNVRIVDDKIVAMTDMTLDGSQFYGKSRSWYLDHSQDRTSEINNDKLADLFLKIDRNEVMAECRRIEKILNDHGMVPPTDDPFDLLLHPDGSWEVVVIDLGKLQKRKPDMIYDDESDFLVGQIKYMQKVYQAIINK